MSNNKEDIKKKNYKDKMQLKKQIIADNLHLIEDYNDEIKLLDTTTDIDKINQLKNEIKKLRRVVGGLRCSVTNSNKGICKIIGPQMKQIDYNVLLILLDYIIDYNKSYNILFNLLLTDKLFNNLIQNEYNYYLLLFKKPIRLIMNNLIKTYNIIKIPKNIFKDNNITLEQIFYVPLTPRKHTILHLCSTSKSTNLLASIYKNFPNLNINCLTESITSWTLTHPLHTALLHRRLNTSKLLLEIGIDKIYITNGYGFDQLINRSRTLIKSGLRIDLYNSMGKYNNKLHTEFNFQSICNDEYLMNILTKIHSVIKCNNMIHIIGK